MNKSELRKKLNQPYTQENWKSVVDFVFPHFSEFSGNQSLPIAPKDQDKVESFKQIGQVRLADGKNLALFELKLKENVNIIRNRVALNDIVSSYIDQEQIHGVLSIFEQGKEDYRFTFSARASEFDEEKGDFKTKATDTKRYTYVLGKNESCKTPAERFFQLSQQKDKADIQAIEHAFSVETLSKNFFREYKQQYELFVDYLIKTPSFFTAVFNNDDKAIRDWVKLLLGRLVFIKFVQKKGWLGVSANEKGWQNGNYRFLEENFENFKHQDNFYSQFLNLLFFEGFDTPNRPNNVFDLTGTKIPFLSGGLFDNENPKTKAINFPKEYFAGLFEFLERYNFTIDENDTAMDREVGIDPEMLGHIFENLLEDNKDKGAYYTPKEIVRYMCQESLKEYLKTYLKEQNQWSTEETKQQELEEALHKFVTLKEAAGIIDLDATLAKALKDVKICDPAIGSGAFPMGLLNEIFQLMQKLYDASPDKVGAIWEMTSWQPDKVKLNIIQQSIYGVDIEKGAVEIARLRFWLSLVVDSDEPHALPHLDYKIVVGDSLVSKLEDTIIEIDWEVTDENSQTDLWGNTNVEQRKAILEEITTKQKQIFYPDCDDEALSLEIRNLKIDLLINQLELMVKTQGLEDKPTVQSINLKKQTELWLQTKGWKQQIQRLKQMKAGSKTPLEFFDWKLDFPEIMNPEITVKTGFDILIANPPYGADGDHNYLNKKYILSKKRLSNSYSYFIELGLTLRKHNGSLNYIVPNTWLSIDSCTDLREELLKANYLKHIILTHQVFLSIDDNPPIVDTVIINVLNKKPADVLELLILDSNSSIKERLKRIALRNFHSNKLIELNSLNSSNSFKVNMHEEVINSTNTFRLEDNTKKYFKVRIGVQEYALGKGNPPLSKDMIKEKIYHSNTKIENSYQFFVPCGDIQRYKFNWSNTFIKWGDNLHCPRDKSIFSDEHILVSRIYDKKNSKLKACYVPKSTNNEFYVNNTDSFNIIKFHKNEYDLLYILGIINSELVGLWLENNNVNLVRKIYPKINTKDLKAVPILMASTEMQKIVIDLVSSIIDSDDLNKIEKIKELDMIIYLMYDVPIDFILKKTKHDGMTMEDLKNIKDKLYSIF